VEPLAVLVDLQLGSRISNAMGAAQMTAQLLIITLYIIDRFW
jgi:hypothetical protein